MCRTVEWWGLSCRLSTCSLHAKIHCFCLVDPLSLCVSHIVVVAARVVCEGLLLGRVFVCVLCRHAHLRICTCFALLLLPLRSACTCCVFRPCPYCSTCMQVNLYIRTHICGGFLLGACTVILLPPGGRQWCVYSFLSSVLSQEVCAGRVLMLCKEVLLTETARMKVVPKNTCQAGG